MTWSSPITWATAMIIDAGGTSGLNTQLRDNLLSARQMWDNAISLSLSTNQSIPNNTYTAVSWDTVNWQVGNSSIWVSASGSKLNVPVAGKYDLTGILEWDDNSSGYRAAAWRINGTSSVHMITMQPLVSEKAPTLPFGDIFSLTTADYIEVMAFQNIGTTMNLHAGSDDRTRVCWRFIGAAS